MPALPNMPALLTLLAQLAVIAGAGAQAQPVAIDTRYGPVEIDGRPRKVVSLSYNGADFLLALGVVPDAYRAWYGGDATGLWPWAAPLLGESRPRILRGEIDVEAVALLRPDLIEAQWAGLSRSQYDRLSRIAPVLAPAPGSGDFGTGWQEMLRRLGLALGRSQRAEAVTAAIESRLAGLRRAHPDWQGATATIAWPPGPGIYTSGDVRARLLGDLGFRTPEAAERLSRGGFYVTLDPELSAPLDADALIWLDAGGGVAAAGAFPLRATLRAVREGREIVAPPALAAAMSYSSPLSIPFALDRLEPLLVAAMDGDPSTPVPTTAAAALAP